MYMFMVKYVLASLSLGIAYDACILSELLNPNPMGRINIYISVYAKDNAATSTVPEYLIDNNITLLRDKMKTHR